MAARHDENANGLLRQYFPKGTDLSAHSATELDAVALALNTGPRKTLRWRTPAEMLDEFLRSAHTGSVATTIAFGGSKRDSCDNAVAESVIG